MSSRLRRNWALLQTLVKAKPAVRKSILRTASKDLVSAISEIALNILKGKLPLKERQKNILKKWRKAIKKLSDKACPIHSKKRIVNQSGGFIGSLLGFAIPLITSLIANKSSS